MAHVQDMGKQRKTNRWKARYRAPDGQERARSFDKRIDAEAWLSTQTADVARGQWVDPQLGTITFAKWVDQWEKGLTNLRPTTRALNLGVVHNHLLPRFGGYALARITTASVKAMVAEDIAEGRLSNSAIRRHVIVLRTILRAAVEEGRIGRNPATGIILPPENAREMQFLEPVQIAALAGAFQPHYRPLIFTAAYVGLRWGELAGLRVGNVDPLRHTIKVVEQLVELSGHVSWGPPKTRAGKRTVTMPARVTEMLGVHMGSEVVQRSGLVFCTIQGHPMKRSNFRKLWGRALSTVDIPEGFHFHELRHTAAALSIAQGAHPLTIKERLGHSGIAVTMDTYGHLFPGQDKALAEGLDGVLRDSLAVPSRSGPPEITHLRRSEA